MASTSRLSVSPWMERGHGWGACCLHGTGRCIRSSSHVSWFSDAVAGISAASGTMVKPPRTVLVVLVRCNLRQSVAICGLIERICWINTSGSSCPPSTSSPRFSFYCVSKLGASVYSVQLLPPPPPPPRHRCPPPSLLLPISPFHSALFLLSLFLFARSLKAFHRFLLGKVYTRKLRLSS